MVGSGTVLFVGNLRPSRWSQKGNLVPPTGDIIIEDADGCKQHIPGVAMTSAIAKTLKGSKVTVIQNGDFHSILTEAEPDYSILDAVPGPKPTGVSVASNAGIDASALAIK